MAYTVPNAATAAYPAQADLDSLDLTILSAGTARSGVVQGLAVSAPGGMSVACAAGQIQSTGRLLRVAAATLTIAAADVSNPRFDLVVAVPDGNNVSATCAVVTGTASATPVFPTPASTAVVLASVFIPPAVAAITSGMLVDKRVFITPTLGGAYDAAAYGATPARRMTDGAFTNASTTLTSASAAFTAADVGRQLYAVGLGGSGLSGQGFGTTIASVTNATTVVLSDAPGVTRSSVEFFVGDPQHVAIQAAIDAAANAGGGRVLLPAGSYPLGATLVLQPDVWLEGAGWRATLLWLARNVNATMIKNLQGDPTNGGNAMFVAVRHLALDGVKARQTAGTTLSVAMVAGDTSMTVGSTAGFPSSGELVIDAAGTLEVVRYTGTTATTFTGLTRGLENGTAQGHAIGVTVAPQAHGIVVETTPRVPTQKPVNDEEFDSHQLAEHVYIESVLTDGLQHWGRGESRFLNVQVYRAGRWGYMLGGVDGFWISCTAAETGWGGFYIRGNDHHLVNCKAFYAGQSNTARGYGYYCVLTDSGTQNLTNCGAQDCVNSGFMLDSTANVVLTGCTADSNNTGVAGAGFDFWGSNNCILDGCLAIDRRADGVNTRQVTAVRLRGGCFNNQIVASHRGVNGAVVTAPVVLGATGDADGTMLRINGQGSIKTVAYAATVTPDPYAYTIAAITLTGNITIANPTYAHPGQELTLVLTQDATGGRTVTFGTAFKTNWTPVTTASKVNTIAFVYNGANWIQTAATTGL